MKAVTNPDWTVFRPVIDAELERRNIGPQELARLTGLTHSTVCSALAPDTTNIKLLTLVKIIDAIGWSWATLLRHSR